MKNMTRMLLLALMLMTSNSMWAYDFIVNEIRYNIKSPTEVWVAKYEDYTGRKYEGDIVIPDEVVYQGATYKVTGIDQWAFGECPDLTSVIVGNNVKILEESAFDRSKKLSKVVLGNSVEKIGYQCFYRCELITSIQLPETLTEIGESAFTYTGLTSLVIPDKVTTVGASAFSSCEKLAWVKIGSGLTSIYDGMFYYSKALKSIALPDNVKTICRSSFSRGGIETIYLGKGVSEIERTAFGGCSDLKTVYSASTTPGTIRENAFIQVNLASVNLVVPTGSKSAYQNAPGWKDFGTITEMDNIETADIQEVKNQSKMQGIYDINGRLLPAMQKGLNIVKMSNGETRKVVVK